MERLDADIEAWLAGTLEDDAASRLATRVRDDPAVARRVLMAARFETDLGRAVHARGERRALGFGSGRQRSLTSTHPAAGRGAWALAVAALLLVAVGIIALRQGLAPTTGPVLATVIAVEGPAQLRTGTRTEPVTVGASLTAHHQVVVDGGGRVQVGIEDGSTFTLLPGAHFAPVTSVDAARFYLATGRLEAAVTPHRHHHPMIIGTPHAEATVMGTRFTLDVSSQRTDLTVLTGQVRFDDRVSRERAVVIPGMQRSAGPAVTAAILPRQPRDPDPRVGIELSQIGPSSIEQPFVDVFRTAAPWRGNDERPLQLDAQGWVRELAAGQTAETFTCRQLAGRYPKGRYVCRYEGAGRLEVGGDARLVAQAPGRLELEVDPSDDGIVLRLVATDADDPVRAIRLFLPGHENTAASQPFHSAFLDRWRGAAVIHAGGWAERRSGDADYTLGERLTPGHGPLAPERGRPLEDTLALAHALGADLWLRLPHQATDSYVTAAAELVHSQLKPDQRVYLELGRDLWDGAWEPGRYALAQGEAAGLGAHAGVRWYAQRSCAVFAAWQAVSGADPRVVRVLSASTKVWLLEEMLHWRDTAEHVDVVAVLAPVGAVVGTDEDPDRIFDLDAITVTELLRQPLHGLDTRLLTLRATLGHLRLVGVRAGPQLVVSQKTTAPATWRHHVHLAGFLNDPDIRTILSEWLHVWNRSTGDVILTALPLDRLREVPGPAGEPVDASGLQAYQAVAPWLQRQVP